MMPREQEKRQSEEALFQGAIDLLTLDVERKCLLQAKAKSVLESLSQVVYVRPTGQLLNAPATAQSLFDSMDVFLQDEEKHVAVVLGNPGAGKTTFAKRWLRHRLALFKENSELPLPLFIELSRLGNSSLDDYLEKPIGLSVALINEVKLKLSLVVFLDGYDEIAHDSGSLYLDKQFEDWKKAKFIVSTRHEKFGQHLASEQLRAILTHRFAPLENPESSFMVCELNDFSQREIQEFIQQWESARTAFDPVIEAKESDIDAQARRCYEQIEELRGLMELASNPIILSLILNSLPGLYAQHQALPEAERQHMMRIDIYAQFVKAWFKREGKRCLEKLHGNHLSLFNTLRDHGFKPEGYLERYTENLAYSNLRGSEDGKLKLEIPVADTLHSDLLNANGQVLPVDSIINHLSLVEKEGLLKALRSGCLLKCDNYSFKFFHKSLVEYFTQAHIVRNIGMIDQMLYQRAMAPNVEAKAEVLPASLNTMLLRYEANVLAFLAEQAQVNAPFREALYQVMRLSRTYADISIAAANAIMVLKYIEAPLNLESWQGINIPYADLSHAMLHGVDFRDANLCGVNFAHAYLKDANVTGAFLGGCTWSNCTRASFKAKISALVCTWDNDYALVGDIEGMIHYLRLSSGKIAQMVTQRRWRIFSSDPEQYMVNALAVDGHAIKKSLHFASACGNEVYVWELKARRCQGKLNKHTQPVTMLSYASDGKGLASADASGTVWLWDPVQRTALRQCTPVHSWIKFIAYTPEATLIRITAGAQLILRFGDEEEVIPIHAQKFLSAAYNPDLDRLAILTRVGERTKISYWSVKKKHSEMEWDVIGKEVTQVACVAADTVALGYKNGEVAFCHQEKGLSKRQGGKIDNNNAEISHLLSTSDDLCWIAALEKNLYWGQVSTMRWGSGSEVNQNIVAVVYQENPRYLLLCKESVTGTQEEKIGVNAYDLKRSMLTMVGMSDVNYRFQRLFQRPHLRHLQVLHFLLLNHLLLTFTGIEGESLLFLQWAMRIRIKTIEQALALEQKLEQARLLALESALEQNLKWEQRWELDSDWVLGQLDQGEAQSLIWNQERERGREQEWNFEIKPTQSLSWYQQEQRREERERRREQERKQERDLTLDLSTARERNQDLTLAQKAVRQLVRELVREQNLDMGLERMGDLALKLDLTKTRKKLRSADITAFAYALPTKPEIVFGNMHGQVELLTLEGKTIQSIRVTESHAVTAVAYAPDVSLLVAATEDSRLHCFNLSGKEPVRLCDLSTMGG